MRDFVFYNPTRIIFGRKAADKIGEAVAAAGIRSALLIYGKGSVRTTGLYDRVRASLAQAGVEVEDLAGVQPNPVVSKVREGIALCRERNLEAVIPVGGGSVYDTAKAVAAGVRYEGDIWELYGDRIPVKGALPIFGILTTSATGSEMNRGSIITNEATRQKWGLHSDFIYPTVSIIDPELQATLPRSQTVCSAPTSPFSRLAPRSTKPALPLAPAPKASAALVSLGGAAMLVVPLSKFSVAPPLSSSQPSPPIAPDLWLNTWPSPLRLSL